MNAELVLERGAAEIVAGAERAVRLQQNLRHDEERDAARARRRIGQPRQHQVDDVRRVVVLAVGDEDLLPGDPVVIALRHGAGPDLAEIGARLRLGQVHGTGPFAGDHLRQEEALLLGRAMRRKRLDGAVVEQGAQREGQVGGIPHLTERRLHQPGEPLAAMLGLERNRVPAAGRELAIGLGEPWRRTDRAVLEPGRRGIARPVGRGQHFAGEAAALVKDLLHRFSVDPLEGRQRQHVIETADGTELELQIGQRRHVAGHRQITLPGFMIASGSIAALIFRIRASSTALL